MSKPYDWTVNKVDLHTAALEVSTKVLHHAETDRDHDFGQIGKDIADSVSETLAGCFGTKSIYMNTIVYNFIQLT